LFFPSPHEVQRKGGKPLERGFTSLKLSILFVSSEMEEDICFGEGFAPLKPPILSISSEIEKDVCFRKGFTPPK
jgi:hypothetical protein